MQRIKQQMILNARMNSKIKTPMPYQDWKNSINEHFKLASSTYLKINVNIMKFKFNYFVINSKLTAEFHDSIFPDWSTNRWCKIYRRLCCVGSHRPCILPYFYCRGTDFSERLQLHRKFDRQRNSWKYFLEQLPPSRWQRVRWKYTC